LITISKDRGSSWWPDGGRRIGNREDETSLEATIERENTRDSLPVLTVSDKDKLVLPAYRQQAAHKLAAVIIDLENYLSVGRVFIP
jgi:hypothetical protein